MPQLGELRALCGEMRIGDLVIWQGRLYRLLGFDPMSVVERNAHLEEPDTGRRVLVPAAEIEQFSPESPTG